MNLFSDIETFLEDDAWPPVKAFLVGLEPAELQLATQIGTQVLVDTPTIIEASKPLVTAANLAQAIGTQALAAQKTIGVNAIMVAASNLTANALAPQTQTQQQTN